MLDFLMIATRQPRNGPLEIYPKFIIKKSKDLMIRGGDFYAIWIEERGLWSDDEQDALHLIDRELEEYASNYKQRYETDVRILYMWDSENGMIDRWHKYCQRHMRDSYHALDEKLIFSNTETNKKDYASKKLNYPLEPGDISAYDKLISTLYTEPERHKLEWAIGSIVQGDSKIIQKFMVLYGGPGTGKSTILNIIQQLFEGYYSVFDAKALGSANNAFALEAFKGNPLIAIQHDGDLSKIEDNTRINSIVSHEEMTINEKFKATYTSRFNAFLFMGTNKPVKITDAKSGIIRRLIDVTPSGNKLKPSEYKRAVKQIAFELGGIAHHCREVYLANPGKYDDYIPINMMGASNDFYNYVIDSYSVFKNDNGVTLKSAWEMYKTYCDEAKVPYPFSQRIFKEELKNYFYDFKDRYLTEDGTRLRNYYSGFRIDKFETIQDEEEEVKPEPTKLIKFDSTDSILDIHCAGCPAQYANRKETPSKAWDKVTSTLSSIDTSKLHYVKVPENHIVIDFDIPDKDGNKCFERNLEEASKWPATYAELSKSGAGIHLHYIYSGDPTKLSRVYDDKIEVKVFTGKSSLRRKLTKCNNLPIATISSGLPLKGDKKMVNFESIKSEKGLRTLIKRNLNKEYHPGTKPSIDFIYKILEDAYSSDLKYDITDMRNAVLAFGANSSHQAEYCIKLINKMKFKSEEPSETVVNEEAPIVIYDLEVFPNLLLVNWKMKGENKPIIRMINPKPSDIEELLQFRLVGFNCRRYDNHILYARLMGYTNEQIYNLSQKIINEGRGFFGEAYNISYTDVYDFCSKKQSLKKWEIELGILHKELGLPWDQPVPEEKWLEVAEYCDNDVIATEAVFDARQADFMARLILAEVAGGTANDTTNSLTTKMVFGSNRKPQDQFKYRNMGELPTNEDLYTFLEPTDIGRAIWSEGDGYNVFDSAGRPYFPGYKFEAGKSTYRGEEVGEGGYVYSEPGMYGNVALLDVASMHPASIIAEQLFGEVYTKRFQELRDARVAVKHKDFETAKKMLGGALAKFVEEIENGTAWYTANDLAQALKIAINSVYGLTAAAFNNAFRDPRNIDNIVAKRGALFMINLKHEVQKRGYTVAHIKTDSIKIPDADAEIIQFVMDYGKEYGYTFEHEATYEKMCLVNDAVYIAQYKDENGNPGEWTATGTQFQVPYVFKTLFSKEPIEFEDMCETKSVSKGSLYLDMNEGMTVNPVLEEVKSYRDKFPDWTMVGFEATNKADKLLKQFKDVSDEELDAQIAAQHNYVFVGRVGQFCPVTTGGGVLYRADNGKYYAAAGTKGYRWIESEMIKGLEDEKNIDRSYYDKMVDEAVEAISKYGDFEWFASNDPYNGEFNLQSREQTF